MSQVFSEHEICDGVTLFHHQSDKWKTDLIKVLFMSPLDDATPSRSLAAYLLRYGPARLGGMAGLVRELKDNYGSSLTGIAGRSVSHQVITLRAKAVSRRYLPRRLDTLRRMLRLMDETMRRPYFMARGFDEDSYRLEQSNLIRAIQSQDDQPGSYANRELLKMMFGDHPLSRRIHGDPENVAALELPDVTNDVKNLFRESPCLVYAITDRQGKDVADLVRGQLSLEPRAALSKGRFKMPPRHQRAQTRRGARPLAQSRLAMGFRIADYSRRSDRFAAYMGDFILGGGSTSRLFKVIREKHSLAYSIGSSFDDASGTIYVSAGLDPSTEGRVRKLVGAQVKRLAKHGPTAEETSLALTGFQQSLIGFQDSQDQLIAFDSAQRLKGQKVRTPEQVMASHRRVRPEQVTDLVSRLKLDSVFVLGPNGETS